MLVSMVDGSTIKTEVRKMKIVALGPEGTYGHQAAVLAREVFKKHGVILGSEVTFVGRNVDILTSVEEDSNRECLGIVPIENSSAGLVAEVANYWIRVSRQPRRDTQLCVIGELEIPVRHNLLAHSSVTDVKDILCVKSHPQALAQCMGKLDALGISIRIPTLSTADAAKEIAIEQVLKNVGRHGAAIASTFAAGHYGLNVLVEGLEDFPGNATRFHILGTNPCAQTGCDRTAVIFKLPNESGALISALQIFSKETINMSSIHSIPLGTMNSYAFYVEFDCHIESREGLMVKDMLQSNTIGPCVLGSYPRSIPG